MEKDYLQFKLKSVSLFLIIGLITVFIIYKLFTLMIFPEVKPEKRQIEIKAESILRGNIYDREGVLLALSKRVYNVVVHPDKIRSKGIKNDEIEYMSQKISEILQIDKNYVKNKLIDESMFQYLKKEVEETTKEKLESFNFTGVRFELDFKREYPTKNLMSHIIGFIGTNNRGLESLEKEYDEVLLGINTPNKNNLVGNNLYLTIDKQIQEIVRDNLIKAIQEYEAVGAVGIIYNPISSEILAMSSLPDYNPYTRTPTPMSALAEPFEPGSVFKIFISNLLLKNNILDRNTIVDCKTPINIGGRVIYPNTGHNKLPFEDVIKYSSNVGIIRSSLKLSDEQFYSGLTEFGFGQKTGIRFPIESSGIYRPEKKKGSVQSKAMISIGYEISVTPIQLVVALSSVVNGGIISEPLLVSEIKSPEGEALKKFNPKIKGLSPGKEQEIGHILIDLMRSVVKRGGTGTEANIEGIDIVGKTGTAQRLGDDGTYAKGEVNTTFFGVVKFLKDPIIILVLIKNPQKEKWASKTAAPTFKNIVLDLMDIGKIYEY